MGQVRTCVGCRQQGNRTDLVRVVKFESNLTIDSSKSLPGRGCWIHSKNSCLNTAFERSSFARALRVNLNLQDLNHLKEQAEKMFEN
ncbi:MAG: YlxR family protein [Rhodoluna sp.]